MQWHSVLQLPLPLHHPPGATLPHCRCRSAAAAQPLPLSCRVYTSRAAVGSATHTSGRSQLPAAMLGGAGAARHTSRRCRQVAAALQPACCVCATVVAVSRVALSRLATYASAPGRAPGVSQPSPVRNAGGNVWCSRGGRLGLSALAADWLRAAAVCAARSQCAAVGCEIAPAAAAALDVHLRCPLPRYWQCRTVLWPSCWHGDGWTGVHRRVHTQSSTTAALQAYHLALLPMRHGGVLRLRARVSHTTAGPVLPRPHSPNPSLHGTPPHTHTHLCQGHVAHALVVWVGLEVGSVGDVIKVLDVVLAGHVPGACRAAEAHALFSMLCHTPRGHCKEGQVYVPCMWRCNQGRL